MIRLFASLICGCALVLAAAVPMAGQSPVFESMGGPAYKVVTVVDGLQDPWSIAFLPGGDMLVTEKPGRLRIVRRGTLQPDPVAGVPAVRYQRGGQGGLLDVALHPDFANNRLLYLSYSKPSTDGKQATNPFVGRGDALPEIWTYGHRSPQGVTIHPETGEIWMTEHGPQGGDELNLVLPGRNYGWPVIGYGKDYGGARLHTSVYHDKMEQPIQFWTPVIAPSGLMVYTGDRFPKWRGSIFVGGLTGQQLVRLALTGADGHQIGMMDRPHLLLGYARIRDVRQGPDGYIYLVTDGRYETRPQRIVRLEPAGP
jgi:glucose/arabinose dehydrogenase